MKGLSAYLVAMVASVSLLVASCGQAAPAPAPTAVPAAPTKAAEPMKPASAAPTAASPVSTSAPTAVPAKKTDYPVPGKAVTVIVPYAAGGGTGVAAEQMTRLLEADLKTPFQVVYKPGAGSQVGLTELVKAKPDGYTIGYFAMSTGIISYLDPERQAVYSRKDFQPIATHYFTPDLVSVVTGSPYKTVKDLVDAAKAAPASIKVGTVGIGSAPHLAGLLLEKAAGVKFAHVHFEGDAPAATALLGGHVDAGFQTVTAMLQHVKSGAVRTMGVMDSQESQFLPGVKTLTAQGYNVEAGVTLGIVAPAGTPSEVVSVLTQGIKRAQADEGHKKRMQDAGYDLRFLDSEQFSAQWARIEGETRPLIDIMREK